MQRVYIGIGSNLEQPLVQVRTAIEAIKALPQSEWIACSPLYRSQPVGPQGQPLYVNGVAVIDTELSADVLLERLQAIEQHQGRRRDGPRWGPRTLDLDILLYGQQAINNERLCVPHAEIANRGFVLKPLFDLAPDLVVPGHGPVAKLLADIPTDDLECIADAP
jgi:2-amino-4-hydroxy-6-hydroxymethyldihydropteridine diphosphokinase